MRRGKRGWEREEMDKKEWKIEGKIPRDGNSEKRKRKMGKGAGDGEGGIPSTPPLRNRLFVGRHVIPGGEIYEAEVSVVLRRPRVRRRERER